MLMVDGEGRVQGRVLSSTVQRKCSYGTMSSSLKMKPTFFCLSNCRALHVDNCATVCLRATVEGHGNYESLPD